MGLRITNQDFILRQTERTAGQIGQPARRLASGARIDQAADNGAGPAVSESFRAALLGAQAETHNVQSALSLTQTAQAGLTQVADSVQRLRELALQASSGTLTDENREALNAEAQQVAAQIDQTAQQTEFNGLNPLDGSVASVEVGTADGLTINLPSVTTEALGINELDLSAGEGASAALAQIDTAMNSIDESQAGLGAVGNALESVITTREVAGENMVAAGASINDADIAAETTNMVRALILQEGGQAALAQGNMDRGAALDLLS